jgi:hypothetical protein
MADIPLLQSEFLNCPCASATPTNSQQQQLLILLFTDRLTPSEAEVKLRSTVSQPKSCRTRDHILLSYLGIPNVEGQVPVFISRWNSVAQLYPQARGYLYVASYD